MRIFDSRIWQKFITENAISYCACLGYDKGMEQLVVQVFPVNSNNGYWFWGLTANRKRDVPETVERLLRTGDYP